VSGLYDLYKLRRNVIELLSDLPEQGRLLGFQLALFFPSSFSLFFPVSARKSFSLLRSPAVIPDYR
jgi:hypothetical protein